MKYGFIKVSPELWQTRRLRRLVKRIMRIEHVQFDEFYGNYIIVGRSKHFSADHKEGDKLPQYSITLTAIAKKWFLFRREKISYEVKPY